MTISDPIADTRKNAGAQRTKNASGDIVKLVLEINRKTGDLRKVGGIVGDKVLPAVDENGEPPKFPRWHHQDILVSHTARGADTAQPQPRDDRCGPGYTYTVICGYGVCVPNS